MNVVNLTVHSFDLTPPPADFIPRLQSHMQHHSAWSESLPVQQADECRRFQFTHSRLPSPPPICDPRRRSLQAAAGSFNGYTLLASESNVAYNLIDTRNAFTTRSLDPAHRDTVLSGLLLHVVRKPSTEMLLAAGGINVQSDSVAQICASAPRFRGLISACTIDAGVFGNTTASGTLLGGIGSDPVFNRCDLACPCVLDGALDALWGGGYALSLHLNFNAMYTGIYALCDIAELLHKTMHTFNPDIDDCLPNCLLPPVSPP